MCRSAQKGIYLKELIAEVRAAKAKRKVGRTPAPAPGWAFTLFGKASRNGQKMAVQQPRR